MLHLLQTVLKVSNMTLLALKAKDVVLVLNDSNALVTRAHTTAVCIAVCLQLQPALSSVLPSGAATRACAATQGCAETM